MSFFSLARARVKHGATSGLGVRHTSPFDCDRAAATTCNYQIRWDDTQSWRTLMFIHALCRLGFSLCSCLASSKHGSSHHPQRLWTQRHAALLGCELVRLSKWRCVQPTLSILPSRFTNSQNVTRPVERQEQTTHKPSRIQIVVQGDLSSKCKRMQQKKQGHWFQCKRQKKGTLTCHQTSAACWRCCRGTEMPVLRTYNAEYTSAVVFHLVWN